MTWTVHQSKMCPAQQYPMRQVRCVCFFYFDFCLKLVTRFAWRIEFRSRSRTYLICPILSRALQWRFGDTPTKSLHVFTYWTGIHCQFLSVRWFLYRYFFSISKSSCSTKNRGCITRCNSNRILSIQTRIHRFFADEPRSLEAPQQVEYGAAPCICLQTGHCHLQQTNEQCENVSKAILVRISSSLCFFGFRNISIPFCSYIEPHFLQSLLIKSLSAQERVQLVEEIEDMDDSREE